MRCGVAVYTPFSQRLRLCHLLLFIFKYLKGPFSKKNPPPGAVGRGAKRRTHGYLQCRYSPVSATRCAHPGCAHPRVRAPSVHFSSIWNAHFKKISPAGGCWSRREAPHPWVPALQILAGFCHQVRAPRVRAPTGARTYLQFSKISKKILYKFPRWLLHYLTFGAPLGKIFFTNTRARDKLLRNCLGLFCPSNTLKSYIPGWNFPSFLSQ